MPNNDRKFIPSHYKDQLLDALFHHMSHDMREKIMGEVPKAYNAYVGEKVLTVNNTTMEKEY